MSFLEDVRVVVHEFFTGFDVVDAFDPETLVADDDIAVGSTGMIEKACFIAVHRGVDDNIVINGKEKRVMPAVFVRILRVGFSGRQSFAGILDDAGAGGNWPDGKGAHPLYG